MTNKKSKKGELYFFTGFPGFIARRLVKSMALERRDRKFVFLVQAAFVPKAEQDIRQIATEIPGFEKRARIICGDITVPRLALDRLTFETLSDEITHVFHLAAIYDLSVPRKTAYQVNVDGTLNILEFCEEMKNLERFVYFSTCYVSGRREGLILESDLDAGRRFKNYYEETKFHAEVEVRSRMTKIPTIIIRPSIVVGDSKTGKTDKYDGPYFVIRLLVKLEKLGLPLKLFTLPRIGQGKYPINLVPIDYMTAAVMEIVEQKAALGLTFHVADPEPVPVSDLYENILSHFGIKTFGMIPSILVENAVQLPAVPSLLNIPAELVEYFNHPAFYDTKNTQTFLKGSGIVCPSIYSVIPKMIEFVRNYPSRPFE